MHRTNLKGATGLQMTHSLCIFDTLQLKITSSSLSCAWSYPLNLLAWGVFTLYLKLCTVHQLVEVETCCVSNLLQLKTRHGTTTHHGYGFDSSAMHRQLSYISYFFRQFDLLVLYIMTLNACHEKKLRIKMNSSMWHHSK